MATEPNAITLPELIALCPGSGDSLLAKIDIEGSEWTTLPSAGESLSRCRQLVIEFHDFDRLADPAWRSTAMAVLQTVVATHWPIHVHGNNFEPLVVLGGVPVPRVCEVTFALRSRYRMTPAPGLVPSPSTSRTTRRALTFILPRATPPVDTRRQRRHHRAMNPQHPVHVIGGGLAGCEAAWQIAGRGVPVVLHEMRPERSTEAHKTDQLAELVCSNSFRSDDAATNAVGLLHEELRRAGS